MEKRLLITGFEPFDGAQVNPSWEAVRNLPEQIGGFRICKQEIPTVFGEAAQCVLRAAETIAPHVILCVGQAAGRSAVTPERIAVNIRDARIPDNKGNQPRGAYVEESGPAAYFATVPVAAMAETIRDRGLPAEVSNSAGAFVCNDVLYTLLNHYDGTDTRVGFIHVPNLPQQGEPSMETADVCTALVAAIESCL